MILREHAQNVQRLLKWAFSNSGFAMVVVGKMLRQNQMDPIIFIGNADALMSGFLTVQIGCLSESLTHIEVQHAAY